MPTDTEQLVVSLEARIRDFEKNFEKANRTASSNWTAIERRSTEAAGRLEKTISGAATRMRASLMGGFSAIASSAGITFGLVGLSNSIIGVVNETDALVKSARKIGVSFEGLQELRYGFDLAGVSADTTTTALEQFSRRVAEAAAKGGDLADVLKANGVEIRDATGNMRPLMDLLRDYARLIAGARSEGERLDLAQRAFGRSGTDMALALRDGADAIDAARQAARDAGVVLSNDLAPGVEAVNDQFAKLSAQIEVGFKRAVLNSIGLLSQLREAAAEAAQYAVTGDRLGSAIGRLSGSAINGETNSPTNTPLPRLAVTPKPTIIPTQKPGGGISTRSEREAVEKLIVSLKEELVLIKAGDIERAVANNLRLAGASATAEQRTKITALTTALIEGEKAQARASEAAQFFGNTAYDALDGLLIDATDATEVVDNLGRMLAKAALQAAVLGEGPLAALFGTSAATSTSSPIGGLLSLLFGGFRADGGDVQPGTAYVVGERRPEVFVPRAPGTILPKLPSRTDNSVTVAPTINVRVEGGSRGKKADQDLAASIGREVEGTMRSLVLDEMRRQIQPGGIISGANR